MSERSDDDDAAMRELLDQELVEASLTQPRSEPPAAAAASTSRQFEDAFAAIASTVLKIPPDELDVRQSMARYGVDSIIVTEIMKRISDLIGQPVAPTVFFEAKHLAELAQILHARYAKRVEVPSDAARWIARFRKVAASGTKIPLVRPAVAPAEARPSYEPVAIIAMEGMFAESADLQAFEKHLRDGDDCISEVPADRWDWRAVYGDPKQGEFTNVKHGGFVPDIDKFDPQFFGMSPREAELTDPQHRLFIQCVWKLIESAGYAPRSLAGRKIGIFLGINLQDYAHLIDRAGAMEAMHLTSLGHMFCPNRLSFYLDTHGPSQVIDTACSSSLVALHRAVLAVQHEGCEMAIAGGANLMISSDMHVMYSKVGMICEDGRCKTFSREANGYARGDGVGAVLVKPLAQAERDGDTILAVIRGSAENHGGASTSLTAPNPKAQASLIVEAHRKAGSDPRSVGYIECHGTGTALGDPIEVNGLKMAFETLYRSAGLEPSSAHCGLGSVKSNIGHAETAAGIAGVIKTVLSLRHGRLYPTLHCDDINPMIELERSPFYILQRGQDWPHPVIDGEVLPRRAGVSSFGAGGSNAHVVIEEYVARPTDAARAPSPSLIPLSAQNAARLDELLKDLLHFLEETPEAERPSIGNVAFTLQVGRDAMAERLAIVTDSTTGLMAKLRQLVQGGAVADCYRGTVKRGKEFGPAASSLDLRRLAEGWVKGSEIDWQALHVGNPRRVSLPTYPFARQRYWLPQSAVRHPLIHRDTSDASEQRFTSVFTGAEFFLADHVVSGEKVLPGVAYLEMARAAVGKVGLRLKNVVWARSHTVGAVPQPLHIGLAPPQNGQIAYRIYSEAGLHGQGTAVLEEPAPSRIDLEILRRTITNSLDVPQCYDAFTAMGIVYGPGHRCLDTVHFSTGANRQVLARLKLSGGAAPYVLHPGLIDSALQACMGLVGGQDRERPTSASLPFALDMFELVVEPPPVLWAWIRAADGYIPNDRLRKLDIDLADDSGQVCVRLRGFSSRTPNANALVGHEPVWVVQPAAQGAPDWSKRRIVLCDLDSFFAKTAETPGIAWSRLRLGGAPESWYADAAIGVFETIKAAHAEQGAGRALIQVVVPRHGNGALLGGLSGLVKTANRESTRVFAQLVEVVAADDLAAVLDAESSTNDDHVRYDGGVRRVMRWQEREAGTAALPWKENGVYLITGGSGGLGQVFARHIAKQAPTAKIILCGRRQQVDVGRRDQVDAFVADVVRTHGRIDGVLHCAGLLRDNYIARKSAAEFAEVLAPKVAGALYLDAATAGLDLDFFALFSSAAGALGSAGQADYATANAFLDAFAHHRNAQVHAGSRRGHTVSIDWPLWAEGGMRMEPAAERMMRQTTGMEALPSDLGVRAFEEILGSGIAQALVLYGSPARLRRSIAAPDVVVARTEEPRPAGTAERRGKIEQMLLGAVASLMKFELADLDVETEWSQYGFDSISLTEFSNKLNQQHRLELTPTVFFEYPTIGALAAWLADNSDLFPALPTAVPPPPVAQPRFVRPSGPFVAPVEREADASDTVAIIGMSGRFPMAKDIEEFWINLQAGRDCISEIPSERNWEALGDEPRWGGFIDGIGNFDARFFGISPREAEQMDPQQRLLMEYAWKAIEDAGYAPVSLSGSNTALFVGTASSGYGNLIMQSGAAIEGYSSTAVVGSIGPNRMSYFLNLHGPSEPIETACSSSLVAIHRALSAMAAGDCDQAIVGGINLILSPETHTSFAKAGMLCPDGRCKTFSRHANGYVRGEGVGMLFLKKLRAAERDGDHIYGVIRGSAENHGGRANSLTAPNPKAQADLLKRAFTRAGVDPRTVGYIEAHGTGTELGDPIEVNGLKTAFRDLYASTGGGEVAGAHCGVGSVKSNIGHLELAAGVAGVIKVLLQLRHRTLVPTLHCDEVNPYIQLQGSPFYLVRENREWIAPRDGDGHELPRRAGVSSFGFGGVNAHVVIEEYAPRREVSEEWPSPGLVVLSAKTAERLKESASALLAFVKEGVRPEQDDALIERIRDLTAEILRVAPGEIDAARPLEEYGVDVLQRSMLGSRLAEALGVEVDAAAVLRERTILAIAGSLLKQPHAPATTRHSFRLEDLAYTLQVGRDAMDERLAFVAGSIRDLECKLQAFVNDAAEGVEDLFTGQARQNKGLVAAFSADEELQEALEKWIRRGKFSKLLDLWTKGLAVDWVKLYGETGPFPWKPRRISLPGYSFAAQRHWVKSRAADPATREEKAPPALPPLVQDSIAALTGAEFFLADHRVQGHKVLPGVVYLEMMRAAASYAGMDGHPSGTIVQLKDVVWIKPAIVEKPRSLRVDLSPGPHGGRRGVISSDGETHSEGTILSVEASQPQLDLAALRAQPGWKRFDAETCYRLFSATGLDYGPAHRGVAELHVGAGQVLARLVLPQAVAGTLDRYILHPSLLDSALQASIGFALGAEAAGEDQPAKLALPFAVETVDVFGPCTSVMWAHVRRPARSSPNDRLQKLDIDLCDEDGRIRVRISGFSSRLLARAPAAPPAPARAEPVDLKAQTIAWFKELLAKELGFPIDEIREDEALDSYGIDSMMAMELTRALEKPFGEVSKTLFFEHHTLAELVDYFLEVHRPKLLALFDRVAPLLAPAPAPPPVRPSSKPASSERSDTGTLDIAIIGLSGRYPQSPDIEAFWRNLRDGKDCITEVPADRWDWRAYYSEDRNETDRHYCKWGGFIADVDKFDPLFFNISPGAAKYIDPQERVFLEHAWMAMEDAGYRREDLHKSPAGAADDDLPGQVGVYAGVMYGEYQMVGLEARLKGEGAALASFYASVANRVSHVLDLHGPSMAVDTMCSSSLTAIHLACQDLKLGRTDFALAGGVNLNLHPNKYSLLSQGQYISSNGRCESFGAGGDGYVPSEGVGVVMLKRLTDAERDGDHIYGVIKSSALNHGGRTNGYSVPNPKAQQAVIGRALREARIDPRAIGYIEAHGTGTRLGDPIEITGLAKALGGQEAANGACWIGSSKSNIGHCEAAAGIAGLTKILLQMREGEIAPSLHAETLNPNIDFAQTPFQVNRQLREWSRPTVDGRLHPRAAGVSSFGAGGANAHLIIEEYVGAPATRPRAPATASPCLIVLSAKSEEQLWQCAERLREFVEAKDAPPLHDIAYTLQIGREAMPQRLAFTASSLQELAGKLARFLKGDHAGLLAGRAKTGSVVAGGDPLAAWIKGAEIDWPGLYDEDDRPARVSLPTYPFARERYWATHAEPAAPVPRSTIVAAPVVEKALTLRPLWLERAISADTSTAYAEHWVLSAASLPEITGATVVRLDSSFIDRAVQLFERIKALFQSRPRAPVLVQVVVEGADRLDAGLAGLLRTARMENPQLIGQLIEVDASSGNDLGTLLRANGRAPVDLHVRYRGRRREVMNWAELADGTSPPLPIWRQGGTYLIVGGAGGLGLHFSREIVRQVSDVTLILTGRSPLDGKRLADIEALKALGARVEYRAVDVADGAAVRTLIDTIGGSLNGVIHSAGILRDSYILKKTVADFRDVLASKVLGAVNLDAATERLDLDFFILFSSLAGAVGNPGQADYATANAFLDAFAADRTRRGRSGRTLSINWPLWQDGGMRLDAQSRELMWQRTGLKPLLTGVGIDAFYRALQSGADQVLVLQGDAPRLRHSFLSAPIAPLEMPTEEAPTAALEGGGELVVKVQGMLARMLAEMLKIPMHRIEIDVPLEEYGIDSVAMMKLGNDLERILGPLPKTLFYEHPSVEAASSFIAEACRSQLAKLFEIAPPAPPKVAPVAKAPIVEAPVAPVDGQDVAVIGMSGRFPMARDVDEFWQNLVQGRDCITEVPAERWDHSLYFDPDKDKPGKTYCKWGGFLDDVDRFDAKFFRISPSEAELLDPQERLFLETAWTLLESSGYLGETLQRLCQSKVGVFVGSMSQQYHAVESDPVREAVVVLSSPSSIANRVSYFFNFQGPSVAIDTMCSSALNAIHMACDSLRRGDCKAAIAGGVNLTIHPKKYVGLSVAQMVGSHPGCTSFGDGDGYLPAEAVGAVLLKPLRDAIADGDEILAVIKSTAVNHGGQSSGYRVPSAAAQTELIAGNFARAGIDPRSVSYVESAANGSAMGDAIELRALSAAFAYSTEDRQFCAIGSVKSNIGHAEAASGVTQLIKVLLQLRHRQLVPTIKAQPLNPNIAFEETPFNLQRTLGEWRRPDGDKRRASVSSFGAGGSNAHLIVEEYEGTPDATGPADGRQLILLSAKTRSQLDSMTRRLLAFVEGNAAFAIADLAYTLQTAREPMEHRLAFVVENRAQLIEALRAGPAAPKLFTGDATEDNSDIRQLLSGKAGRTMLDMLLAERDLEKLALYWTKGVKIAWQPMYTGQSPQRIALPTYPFERQSHWLAAAGKSAPASFVSDARQPLEDNVRRYMAHALGELLGVAVETVDPAGTLQDHGVESIAATKLRRGLEQTFGVKLSARDMLTCSDLAALVLLVAERQTTPLSEGQKGLWLLHQLAPQTSAYNVPMALRFEAGLDIEVLRQACVHMLRRFPVLASVFGQRNGEPFQRVEADPHLVFEHERSDATEEAAVIGMLSARSKRPFDLEHGPLFRVHVISSAGGASHVLLVVHHIVFDGSSAVVLARALDETYRALLAGDTPSVAAESADYGDFVRWQQRFLASDDGQAQLGYWRRRLDGDLPVLALPADLPRPARRRFDGASHAATVTPELSRGIAALARSLRINPSIVFLGAYSLLLNRYAGDDDLLVGMPASGRPESRFEETVGYFVNMLCIRARVVGAQPASAFLKELQLTVADAMDNGDYPFPALLKALKIDRDPARSPLFQAMFAYQNFVQPGEAGGLGIAQEGGNDLALEIYQGIDSFSLRMDYDVELFRPATIGRAMAHYIRLLESMVLRPDAAVADLSLTSPQERLQLLADGQAAEASNDPNCDIVGLFQQQARLTPDGAALAFEGQSLSYRELDEQSTRLARELGEGGGLIGVCLPQGFEMIVAMLAIWKAGAVYVPVALAWPSQRRRQAIDASGMRALIGEGGIERSASARIAPPDAAYVIYTSGSTGQPKGVVIGHRSIAHHCQTMRDHYGLGPQDKVLQFASMSVDASLEQVLPALLSGATVVLRPERLWSAAEFRGAVAALGLTAIDVSPSYLHELLLDSERADGWRAFDSLRIVTIGGEALMAETLALWRASPLSGRCRLVNAYGPTETTVTSLVCDLADEVSIGKPLPGESAYVLDAYGQPCPVGVVGELHIGGIGLALGYLDQPELTRQKFIDAPLMPGARLYRTGDRAGRREDGAIDFIGRLDQQVKVRGFRVECGEVESALRRLHGVAEAVVLLRGDRLAAFVAPEVEGDLKTALAETLPDYMIPSTIRSLPALPLTPGGKVDRAALRQIDLVAAKAGTDEPRTETERRLRELWRQVLAVDRIGVHDNFFDLGGHSLLAVRLMSLVHERFGGELPLSSLFEAPDIARQAALLDRGGGAWSPLVCLQPKGTKPPIFCVHAVAGDLLTYRALARQLGEERPFYGLQAPGIASGGHPGTIEGLATLYIGAIRRVQLAGPYRLAGWSMGGVIAYEMARQLRQAGERVASLALIDSYTPDAVRGLEPVGDALLQANARAMSRYTLGRYEGDARLFAAGPADVGWAKAMSGGFSTVTIPGDHESLLADPNVQHLARALNGYLDEQAD